MTASASDASPTRANAPPDAIADVDPRSASRSTGSVPRSVGVRGKSTSAKTVLSAIPVTQAISARRRLAARCSSPHHSTGQLSSSPYCRRTHPAASLPRPRRGGHTPAKARGEAVESGVSVETASHTRSSGGDRDIRSARNAGGRARRSASCNPTTDAGQHLRTQRRSDEAMLNGPPPGKRPCRRGRLGQHRPSGAHSSSREAKDQRTRSPSSGWLPLLDRSTRTAAAACDGNHAANRSIRLSPQHSGRPSLRGIFTLVGPSITRHSLARLTALDLW